jgi:hypothetical protein
LAPPCIGKTRGSAAATNELVAALVLFEGAALARQETLGLGAVHGITTQQICYIVKVVKHICCAGKSDPTDRRDDT